MKKLATLSFALFLGGLIYTQNHSVYQTVEHKYPTYEKKTRTNNLRILLTDAPNDKIKEVFVNIDHVEILFNGQSGESRMKTAQDMGAIDLLKLRDGVSLPMADIQAPINTKISQIRFVLKDEGHYITNKDGSTCQLQTPSQQQSGLKILVKENLQIEEGSAYSLLVDFDAMKSIVQQGNGGCLLKPVLKLKKATKIAFDDSSKDNEEVLVDNEDESENEQEVVASSDQDEQEEQELQDNVYEDEVTQNDGGEVAVLVPTPVEIDQGEEEGPSEEESVASTSPDTNSNNDSSQINDGGDSSGVITVNPPQTEDEQVVADEGAPVNDSSQGSTDTNVGSTTPDNLDSEIDPNDPSTWPQDYSKEEFAEAYPHLVENLN